MLYCGRCDKEVNKLPCDCKQEGVEKMVVRHRDDSGAWVVDKTIDFNLCSICKVYDCGVHGVKVRRLSEIAAYMDAEKPAKVAKDMYCEPHASQIWDWHQQIMRLEFTSMRKALDVMTTMDKEEWVREAVRASPDQVKVGDFGGEEKEKWFKAFVCEAAEMNVWERKIQIQLLRSFIR